MSNITPPQTGAPAIFPSPVLNTQIARRNFLQQLLELLPTPPAPIKKRTGSAGTGVLKATKLTRSSAATQLINHFIHIKDYPTAEAIIKEIIPAHPKNKDLISMLILTYIRRNDIESGVKKLERLEKAEEMLELLNTKKDKSLYLTAKAYLLQEKISFATNEDEMKAAIEEAILAARALAEDNNNSDDDDFILISQLYSSMCEIETAGDQLAIHIQKSLHECLKAHRLAPSNPRIWNQIIYTLQFYIKIATSDKERIVILSDIEKRLRQLESSHFDLPHIYQNMAWISYQKGKYATNDTERIYLLKKAEDYLTTKSDIRKKHHIDCEDYTSNIMRGHILQIKAEQVESEHEKINYHIEAIKLFNRSLHCGNSPEAYSGMTDSLLALAGMERDTYKKRAQIEKAIKTAQEGIEKGGLVIPIYRSLHAAYSKLLKLLPNEEEQNACQRKIDRYAQLIR